MTQPYEVSARERELLKSELFHDWWDKLDEEDEVVGDRLIDTLIAAGWAPKVEFGAFLLTEHTRTSRPDYRTIIYQENLLRRSERQLAALKEQMEGTAQEAVEEVYNTLTDASGEVYHRAYGVERDDHGQR